MDCLRNQSKGEPMTDVCDKHHWKMWMPNGIYKCSACGQFKLKLKETT